MENNSLGSKKMNNKQDSGENSGEPVLKKEIEIDKDGNHKVVQRSRSVDNDLAISKSGTNIKISAVPSKASEELGKKMVENKDKNSDIAMNRYPNSSPENHENRGNL